MPSKEIEAALKGLRRHHYASKIINAICASPKFPKDRTFDDLYDLIVAGKAGFARTALLTNILGHVKHDVYLHPDVIGRWKDLRGYYTNAGIISVLCLICLDNPMPSNGWQLSTQTVQNAMSRPSTEFDVFIGYAIAPPGAMVIKPITLGPPRRPYYQV